jgi:hypothetical protein
LSLPSKNEAVGKYGKPNDLSLEHLMSGPNFRNKNQSTTNYQPQQLQLSNIRMPQPVLSTTPQNTA